jgi:SnoaL-like domain
MPRTLSILFLTATMYPVIAAGQAPQTLTGQDRADIQALVTGYARALGSCDATGFADLFGDTGYFASGFRGQVSGRARLIALIESERQCIAPPDPNRPDRPVNAPTVVLDVTPDGVFGIADLGGAGRYEDEYVRTPNGWRVAARTVITPAEKAAGLDAAGMRAIRLLAGGRDDAGEFWAPGQDGVKRFQSAGVVIGVSEGTVTGRIHLKDGGYYDDVYEKTSEGRWRFRSRTYVPDR